MKFYERELFWIMETLSNILPKKLNFWYIRNINLMGIKNINILMQGN